MDTTQLQQRLSALGFDPGPVDGQMGPRTKAAISAFQKSIALAGSGIPGPKTYAALMQGVPADLTPPWLALARGYLGIKEGVGALDNPAVVALYGLAGQAGVKHDSVPWCAAFVGAMLAKAGLRGTGTLWALDYANWGVALPGPVLGCVATKKRAGGGHVGFVVGATASTIYLLGGNQSDSVSIAAFPRSSINAFRWPSSVEIPANPILLPSSIAGAKAGVSQA